MSENKNDPILELNDNDPINGKVFKKFYFNDFTHLCGKVDELTGRARFSTKLSWIILSVIIAEIIVDKVF